MSTYLLLGLWTYIVLTITRFDTFKAATVGQIVKGFLFTLFLWPLGLLAVFLMHTTNLGKEKTDEQP